MLDYRSFPVVQVISLTTTASNYVTSDPHKQTVRKSMSRIQKTLYLRTGKTVIVDACVPLLVSNSVLTFLSAYISDYR